MKRCIGRKGTEVSGNWKERKCRQVEEGPSFSQCAVILRKGKKQIGELRGLPDSQKGEEC